MKLEKHAANPILKANPENDWESLCVLNPGVIYDNGIYYMLYRAAGNDASHYIRLGLAASADGVHFTRQSARPVLEPDYDGPDGGGVEDPRIVKIGEWFYVVYASRPYAPGQYWKPGWKPVIDSVPGGPRFINNNDTVSYLAVTRDFKHFKKLGRLTDTRRDNRDVILFPEKIKGRYVLLTRPMDEKMSIWISYSDDMMEFHSEKIMLQGEQWWEDKKIGASCPPIRTEKGWFLIYHGVSGKDNAYRAGAVLLDLEEPEKIRARTKNFILEPEYEDETSGYYNGCVFPTGNAVVNGVLYVYYGAADKYVCLATVNFSAFLDYLSAECKI